MYLKYSQQYKKDNSPRTQKTLSLETIITEGDFRKKIFIIQWNIRKKWSTIVYNKIKYLKSIPDTCNAKEYYQSFLRKKNTRPVKQ